MASEARPGHHAQEARLRELGDGGEPEGQDGGLGDDGEILEINQVAAYFAYANRTVLGLGINTEGDDIGLSPGDSSDPDNWSHA